MTVVPHRYGIQGSTDIPLNEYGIELAKITRDGIEKRDFNLILFMQVPASRARKTAEILRFVATHTKNRH